MKRLRVSLPATLITMSLLLILKSAGHSLAEEAPVSRSSDQSVTRPSSRSKSNEVPPLQDLSPSRPGYRHTVTKMSQEFYRYIMNKASRGEEITSMERLTIALMIKNRTWPEPPELNELDKKILDEIDKHDSTASSLMKIPYAARGKLDYDLPDTEQIKKFRDWYYSVPSDKRSYVAKMMKNYYTSLGFDMRSEEIRERERKKQQAEEERRIRKAREERQRKEREALNERDRKQYEKDKAILEGMTARDRLTEKVRESKREDSSRKPWEQMKPEERRDALKTSDPKAWEKVKEALTGHQESAKEVIEAIDSKKTAVPVETYDPRRDPNLESKGARSDPVDITQAEKSAQEFQQGQRGGKKGPTEQGPQTVTKQPESYTTDPGKKPDASSGAAQTPFSPYPYGYPPEDRMPGVRVPWDTLAGSPGYGSKTPGGSEGSKGSRSPDQSSASSKVPSHTVTNPGSGSNEPSQAQLKAAYNEGCMVGRQVRSGELSSGAVKELIRTKYDQGHQALKNEFRRGWRDCQ